MMEKTGYQKVWNLDTIFLGGSKSNQFLEHMKRLEVLVYDLEKCIESFTTPLATNDVGNLVHLMEKIGDIRMHLSQANSFITCLLAQNSKDQDASSLRGQVAQNESRFEKELAKVKNIVTITTQDVWESLL
jgi:oligoendopeptidase F